jgi:hypothetical protein
MSGRSTRAASRTSNSATSQSPWLIHTHGRIDTQNLRLPFHGLMLLRALPHPWRCILRLYEDIVCQIVMVGPPFS